MKKMLEDPVIQQTRLVEEEGEHGTAPSIQQSTGHRVPLQVGIG